MWLALYMKCECVHGVASRASNNNNNYERLVWFIWRLKSENGSTGNGTAAWCVKLSGRPRFRRTHYQRFLMNKLILCARWPNVSESMYLFLLDWMRLDVLIDHWPCQLNVRTHTSAFHETRRWTKFYFDYIFISSPIPLIDMCPVATCTRDYVRLNEWSCAHYCCHTVSHWHTNLKFQITVLSTRKCGHWPPVNYAFVYKTFL